MMLHSWLLTEICSLPLVDQGRMVLLILGKKTRGEGNAKAQILKIMTLIYKGIRITVTDPHFC